MDQNKSLSTPSKLVTQVDAVIYFLQKLDIEMVSDILEDSRTYQDFEKSIFIHKLGNALDEFIGAGDTFLECYSGFCNARICNYKCSGFSFIGNNSNNYFDLIIENKKGVVHDIYECTEFKSLETGYQKEKRVRIDNSRLQFYPPF